MIPDDLSPDERHVVLLAVEWGGALGPGALTEAERETVDRLARRPEPLFWLANNPAAGLRYELTVAGQEAVNVVLGGAG